MATEFGVLPANLCNSVVIVELGKHQTHQVSDFDL